LTFFLDTGWGMFILTLVACGVVVGACTIAATVALVLVAYALRTAGRLTER
jgi:hypothetical protein